MLIFYKNFKSDIITLGVLSLIYFLIIFKYGSYFTNVIIDIGRELYYPELMLKGKLLYKDLFNLFGPLGYQINCLLYRLLGVKISSLLVAGEICSFFILYLAYFISRYFLNVTNSFICCLFFMTTCIFNVSVFNFIFPYSFSLLYAYLFFLSSVLCFLYVFKYSNKNIFLVLSYFFLGVSISSKYEYIPFVLILLFYTIFVFKKNIKDLLLCLFAFILVPVISYGILFFDGVSIVDLLKNQELVLTHIHSKSLYYFYTHSTGTYFSLDLFNKFLSSGLEFKVLFFLLPYLVYGIFIYMLIYKLYTKSFNLKTDTLFVLVLIAIISMLKTAFFIDIDLYGNYTILLPLVAFLAFVIKISKNMYKCIKEIFFIIFIILFLSISYYSVQKIIYIFNNNSQIKTEKGVIYDAKQNVELTKVLLEYLKRNISDNKSLLVLPEGVMINYITGYDMKLYNYYSLLPTFIDTFGIDKILTDIENAKIDYILLVNNRSLQEYGGTFLNCNALTYMFMTGNEKAICNFLVNKYQKQKVFYFDSVPIYSLYERN